MGKPIAFAFGIARLFVQEEGRRKKQTVEAIRSWEQRPFDSGTEKEVMDEALGHCLAQLQPERRELLERYYLHTGIEKARSHQKLAEETG